jgi:hypothetical protein
LGNFRRRLARVYVIDVRICKLHYLTISQNISECRKVLLAEVPTNHFLWDYSVPRTEQPTLSWHGMAWHDVELVATATILCRAKLNKEIAKPSVAKVGGKLPHVATKTETT